jgi:predicted GNAT family N-acyltransferase
MTRDTMLAPHADALAAAAWFEALAARMVARAAPLRFEVVSAQNDLRQIYRLRRAVAIEKGWARPEEIGPDGDFDRYDDEALHIAGRDGTELVAASRLVLPAIDRALPTEEAFAIRVNSSLTADVGRVAVAAGYRGAGHRVLWALLCKTWLEQRARGFTSSLAVVTSSVERMYRSWGSFDIVTLAAPRDYWGEMRYPILIRPVSSPDEKLRETVSRADPGFSDSRRYARLKHRRHGGMAHRARRREQSSRP